jgi:hypothetical protein
MGIFERARHWLIVKLIGRRSVAVNVTVFGKISLDGPGIARGVSVRLA